MKLLIYYDSLPVDQKVTKCPLTVLK